MKETYCFMSQSQPSPMQRYWLINAYFFPHAPSLEAICMCAEICQDSQELRLQPQFNFFFFWLHLKCQVPEEKPSLCHPGPGLKKQFCNVPTVKIIQKLLFLTETQFPHLQMKITLSYYPRASRVVVKKRSTPYTEHNETQSTREFIN